MRHMRIAVVLALVGAGCRVPPKGGLDEVARLLEERGAPRLRWNQSLKEDEEAGRALDRILLHELTPAGAIVTFPHHVPHDVRNLGRERCVIMFIKVNPTVLKAGGA